jgi:hypothetical protein
MLNYCLSDRRACQPYLLRENEHSLETSIMNYVIDLFAEQGHLIVRYGNAGFTGPSVSVWMVPTAP